MARFLNKSTKQFREDDGTGQARENEIRNPDLSAVAEVPQARWVIDGETVRAPNEQETAAFDAADLQAAKVAKCRAIDSKSAQLIQTAAVVVNGESISASQNAQINMIALKTKQVAGELTYPAAVSSTDGGEYQIADEADFIRVSNLVFAYVKNTLDAGRSLRAQVLACTTLAGVAAVEDNR
jgi:hypothetical protein